LEDLLIEQVRRKKNVSEVLGPQNTDAGRSAIWNERYGGQREDKAEKRKG